MNESAPGNRPISRTHFSSAHEASRADEKSVREILRGRVVSIEFGARPISCVADELAIEGQMGARQ